MDPPSGLEVWEDGQHLVEPPGDEKSPTTLLGNLLTLPSFFPFPLASLDPRLTVQVDAPSTKRPGDPLDGGSSKEQPTVTDKDERIWTLAPRIFRMNPTGSEPAGFLDLSGE